tara:strand:- start:317 stop:547 length:231 start_codon:yes stop_codon:yes gene_type:complete
MPAEIRIDLDRLNEFIDMTESGPYQHKLLYYLLKSMRNMGARWRDPPIIVLTVDDVEADLDEDLQATLDKYTGLES